MSFGKFRIGPDWEHRAGLYLVWCDNCGEWQDRGTYTEARAAAEALDSGNWPHDCEAVIRTNAAQAWRDLAESDLLDAAS